jgi:hypothetical protein
MSYNVDHKKILKIGVMVFFFVIILIYIFFRSHYIIAGVKIENVNIIDGTKISDSIFSMTGKAKNAIKVEINGREIPIDRQGNFEEKIALLKGYNTITITAEDKFGSKDIKNYKLIY